MKPIICFILLPVAVACVPFTGFTQLANGGVNANFGIDADTKSNYVKYGPLSGSIGSDDWFSPGSNGNNVIDTANATSFLSLLQAGTNVSFNKRMSSLLYAKISGKLWLDAAYGRDFVAASSLKDSTTFTIASKNGSDPSLWRGGVSNFPNKNDLVDVFAHMRRDGTNVHDSLWFFTGVSTYGTTGSSYYDIELYKNPFSYNSSTGTFTTAGTDAGHTQWLFDASGKIVQTGDMIVAVNFSPGSVPVVDLRIWVSQSTLSSVVPAFFNFTGAYDGASASPAFGYASIVSKSGSTAWGAGISNYSASAVQDTTFATPWGTAAPSGTANWVLQYQTQQLIEVGLNLTRIGVDPALYSALSPCQSLFANIFFKSRSSNSFTSNLQDFMVPLSFLRAPVMDYSIQTDTLRCNKKTGTILITNNSTMGYYNWKTIGGNISGSSADSSQLSITAPGKYIVSSSPAEGCPATRTDTVIIPIDTFPPVASINVSWVGGYTPFSYFQLHGGDPVASNYPTPFGGSAGLLWNWSGPNAFSSTIQNPSTAGSYWGTYNLTVTEKRNGCTATVSKVLDISDFSLLQTNNITLTAKTANGKTQLSWQDQNKTGLSYYEIEKLTETAAGFSKIGYVSSIQSAGAETGLFGFTDNQPISSRTAYRIKSVYADGKVFYSNSVHIDPAAGIAAYSFIKNVGGQTVQLSLHLPGSGDGTVVIYSINGQMLKKANVQLSIPATTISLDANVRSAGSGIILALSVNNQLVYAQKMVL